MGVKFFLTINFIIFSFIMIAEASQCECGIANEDHDATRRIVGGTPAPPHRYPWLVALRIGAKLHCGGALVTDMHVLTAAHCVSFGFDIHYLTIDVGAYDLLNHDFEEFEVVKAVRFPHFKSSHTRDVHDIAVLTLSSRVQFNNFVKPLCLPTKSMELKFYHTDLTVAGWGKTDARSLKMSRLLRETRVHLVTPEACKKIYRDDLDTSTMICAYSKRRDACQGDSGGPLFGRVDGKYYQVGVVSWGADCGNLNYPGVYTDVAKYLSWIKETTINGKFCS